MACARRGAGPAGAKPGRRNGINVMVLETRGSKLLARLLSALAALAAVAAAGPVAAASHRMPSGAFLRTPARTTGALRQAVRTDPIVRSRYLKRFGVARPQDLNALFARLRIGRLRTDRILRVYYTRPGGRQGFKIRRVRRGTLVFQTAEGRPLLVQVCGNPLMPDPRIEALPEQQQARHLAPNFDPTEPADLPDFWDALLAPKRPDDLLGLADPPETRTAALGFPIAFVALLSEPADLPEDGLPWAPPSPKPPAGGGGADPNAQPVPPDNPPTPPVPPVPPDNPPGPPGPPKPPGPPTPPVVPVSTPEPTAAVLGGAMLIAAGALAAGRRRTPRGRSTRPGS